MTEPSSRSMDEALNLCWILLGRVPFPPVVEGVARTLDARVAEERERVLAETPETIEAMARAGFADEFGVPWEHLQEAERDEWRGAARTALAALRAEVLGRLRQCHRPAARSPIRKGLDGNE